MPNSIDIGFIHIHVYGIMVALGLCAAVFVSAYRAKRNRLDEDLIYTILAMSLIGGFIGTRVLFYLTVIPDIMENPSILWNFSNGYVVYGGVIGGVLANVIYFKVKKREFLPYFDLIMPQVALAQAIGRIGCFFAGCCYGSETDLPIGFTYHTSDFAPTGVSLIPTQLISSVGDLIIFVVLLLYAKRKEAKGTVGALYLMLYSAGRFFVEFLRGDEERGSIGVLSVSQVIAIVVFFGGLLLYVLFVKVAQRQIDKLDEEIEESDEEIEDDVAFDVEEGEEPEMDDKAENYEEESQVEEMDTIEEEDDLA